MAAFIEPQSGFMLYVATWRGCEVQKCSLAAQGLWMNMLCEMHVLSPRGVAPGNLPGIASMLGFQPEMHEQWIRIHTQLIAELEQHKVFSRGKEPDLKAMWPALPDDAIVNRRMFKKWSDQQAASERGRRNANARWKKERAKKAGRSETPKSIQEILNND